MKKFVCALAAALVSGSAMAQQGTLKFLVGFPAGASLDAMTRMVADKMQASLGQSVIVENRTGAAGQIAMTALKTSPADGSVLVMTPLVTIVTAPHIQQLPYDPFHDFVPVAHTANFLFAFAMGPSTPAKDLK
ncbi:MAG: tripartite tricarboxylate transporter substrate-binding protein, partial [Burkholderiales bacterium]